MLNVINLVLAMFQQTMEKVLSQVLARSQNPGRSHILQGHQTRGSFPLAALGIFQDFHILTAGIIFSLG